MGLMVSILIVCVGVIEVLSCYEHFRNGIIHGATHIYDNIRRGSTFLESAGRKLKLLRNNSLDSIGFRRFHSNAFSSFDETSDGSVDDVDGSAATESRTNLSDDAKSFKKLEKADKIEIVKRRLERQQKPVKETERKSRTKGKTIRSYSMPELEFTPEDIELSQIINELAIEPIAEINFDDEIENEMDLDVINEKFDNLFENLDLPISKSNNTDLSEQTPEVNLNSKKVNKLASGDFDSTLNLNQSPARLENSFNKQSVFGDEKPLTNPVEPENTESVGSNAGERNEPNGEENRRRHLSLISAFEEKSKTKFINPTANIQNGVLECLSGRNRSKDVEPGSFDVLTSTDADEKQPFAASDDIRISGPINENADSEWIGKNELNLKEIDSKEVSKEPFASSNDSVDIFSFNESIGLDQFPLEQSLTGNSEIMELCGETVEEDDYVDDVFEKIYSNLEKESVTNVPITCDVDEKPLIDWNEKKEAKSKEEEEKISKSASDERISPSIINQFSTDEITGFADKFINFCFKDLRSELLKRMEKVKDESAQNGERLNFYESKYDEIDFDDESKTVNDLLNAESQEKPETTSDFGEDKTEPEVEDFDSGNGTLVEGLVPAELENGRLGNDFLNCDSHNEKPIRLEENVATDASPVSENKNVIELSVDNGTQENVVEEVVVSSRDGEVEDENQERKMVNEMIEPEETKCLSPASIDLNKKSVNVPCEVKGKMDEQKKVAEDEDEIEEVEEVEYIIEYEDESSEECDEDADEYDLVLEKSSNSTPSEAEEKEEKITEKVFPVMADQPETLVPDDHNLITLKNEKNEKFNENDSTLKTKTEFLIFDKSSTESNEDSGRLGKNVPENVESRQKENEKTTEIEIPESNENEIIKLEGGDEHEENRIESLERNFEESDSIDLNEYLVPEEKSHDSAVKDEENQKSIKDRDSSTLCWGDQN